MSHFSFLPSKSFSFHPYATEKSSPSSYNQNQSTGQKAANAIPASEMTRQPEQTEQKLELMLQASFLWGQSSQVFLPSLLYPDADVNEVNLWICKSAASFKFWLILTTYFQLASSEKIEGWGENGWEQAVWEILQVTS